jgi:hypothetical protein
MFKPETRIEQAREIRSLTRLLADLVPVAVCFGNHDNADFNPGPARRIGSSLGGPMSNMG